MKVGDKIKKSPMWKYNSAVGKITKITKDYTVVKWDGINGEWHYTKEQSKTLEIINDVLSDEQLEDVLGGMNPEKFSEWRANKVNEST